jgi:hypothetical protein
MQLERLGDFHGEVNFDAMDKVGKNIESRALHVDTLNPDMLLSESTPEVRNRNALRHALVMSSSEKRDEVVAELKKFSGTVANSEFGNALAYQLSELEKKTDGNGLSIDRLLELLFSLLQLMAKVNTERSSNAAKVGEISVQQAKISGGNNVGAANSNLAGSITALTVGVGVAAIGLAKYGKGSKKHGGNLKGNNQKLQVKSSGKNREGAVGKQQEAPVNTNVPQQKLDTVVSKQSNFSAEEASRARLVQSEAKVVDGMADKSDSGPDFCQTSSGDNSLQFNRRQLAGQAISGFSPFVSNIAQSGFGVHAASKSAEAKVNDAEHDISSNMEHNEDQLAQRLSDLMVKLLSLIASASEEANRNVAERSQAIKA